MLYDYDLNIYDYYKKNKQSDRNKKVFFFKKSSVNGQSAAVRLRLDIGVIYSSFRFLALPSV